MRPLCQYIAVLGILVCAMMGYMTLVTQLIHDLGRVWTGVIVSPCLAAFIVAGWGWTTNGWAIRP